jgi:hypothetical protein
MLEWLTTKTIEAEGQDQEVWFEINKNKKKQIEFELFQKKQIYK